VDQAQIQRNARRKRNASAAVWPDDGQVAPDTYADSVPSPRLVAALLVLGRLQIERVPWWAAQWLIDGHDSPALGELAGLGVRDTYTVHDLLPIVLAEVSVALPVTAVAAATVVFDDLAHRCLAGAIGERWLAQQVEDIVIRADYSTAITALPLGTLYGIDDEWAGGWGRTVEELAAAVRTACADQIDISRHRSRTR
jgi:hypothetical protein